MLGLSALLWGNLTKLTGLASACQFGLRATGSHACLPAGIL